MFLRFFVTVLAMGSISAHAGSSNLFCDNSEYLHIVPSFYLIKNAGRYEFLVKEKYETSLYMLAKLGIPYDGNSDDLYVLRVSIPQSYSLNGIDFAPCRFDGTDPHLFSCYLANASVSAELVNTNTGEETAISSISQIRTYHRIDKFVDGFGDNDLHVEITIYNKEHPFPNPLVIDLKNFYDDCATPGTSE